MFLILIFQMSVSSFKGMVADKVGVPVGQQRLIFRGKVLKDEHLLSEYRILQEDIYLVSTKFHYMLAAGSMVFLLLIDQI